MDRPLADVERKLDELDARKADPLLVPFGATTIATAQADRYLLPGYPAGAASATESKVHHPRAAQVTGLTAYVGPGGAAAADSTVSLVLRVNGKDTPARLEFVVPKFAEGVVRSRMKNPVNLKRDDLISVVVHKSAALTTAPLVSVYLELE